MHTVICTLLAPIIECVFVLLVEVILSIDKIINFKNAIHYIYKFYKVSQFDVNVCKIPYKRKLTLQEIKVD